MNNLNFRHLALKRLALSIGILGLTCIFCADLAAQIPPPPPPGGGGGGGGPAGAPIDGGAFVFLAAGAAYGYKKLKAKGRL